jgi:hypothetical protein
MRLFRILAIIGVLLASLRFLLSPTPTNAFLLTTTFFVGLSFWGLGIGCSIPSRLLATGRRAVLHTALVWALALSLAGLSFSETSRERSIGWLVLTIFILLFESLYRWVEGNPSLREAVLSEFAQRERLTIELSSDNRERSAPDSDDRRSESSKERAPGDGDRASDPSLPADEAAADGSPAAENEGDRPPVGSADGREAGVEGVVADGESDPPDERRSREVEVPPHRADRAGDAERR